jgi:hypothetical protein
MLSNNPLINLSNDNMDLSKPNASSTKDLYSFYKNNNTYSQYRNNSNNALSNVSSFISAAHNNNSQKDYNSRQNYNNYSRKDNDESSNSSFLNRKTNRHGSRSSSEGRKNKSNYYNKKEIRNYSD